MLNQHDVMKIMGDDFEPNCTTQEAVARMLLSTIALFYAASKLDGETKPELLGNFVQQFAQDVGTLTVRQHMPNKEPQTILPDGPLHDCVQLSASLLDSLRYASKPSVGTLLFLANEICTGLGVDFEQELKRAATGLRNGGLHYPTGEEGASA